MRRIYVASSWRNQHQPMIVEGLRTYGHEVYDFRCEESHFRWDEIDPEWLAWNPTKFRKALTHERARFGFRQDMAALQAADTTVLVLPCGRSAHLELGYAVGQGQETYVLMLEPNEPELMYAMVTRVCLSVSELLQDLAAERAS